MENLDNPGSITEIHRALSTKATLRLLYEEVYRRYAACLERCPRRGLAIEIGSGGGFAKEHVPELMTTDVLAYTGLDMIMDATKLPFRDRSVRFLAMQNVFHHIPDVSAFLSETARCLVPGGRVFIADQNRGWISSFVLRYFHAEPYAPSTTAWEFATTGPLTGANGALAWIVFVRDRARFAREFPGLKLLRCEPCTPLRYWLSGGLKRWCLLPLSAWKWATTVDNTLLKLSPRFGSFLEIELLRTEDC